MGRVNLQRVSGFFAVGFLALVVVANLGVLFAALFLEALVIPMAIAAVMAVGILVIAIGTWTRQNSREASPAPGVESSGGYELMEKLAAGSMGEVWLARHQKLGRDVALKKIKPGNVDAEDTRRFEREARVLSKLRSPHTVEVFDFGVQPNGELYYAMELLDGLDLQTTVREQGPLLPERVVYLLLQACASLHEAHQQGLVHRDIKPANFMICRYGGEFDFLKILDFGLVKKPPGQGSVVGGLTRPATVLGTAAYVAPESMSGSKFVDHRADLYAFGAVGFWLLTRRLLFEHDQPLAMVRAHLTEPPPKASAHSPFAVPALLDGLLHDCVAKQPDARPPNAAAIRTRLEAVPLAAPWNQDRAAAWWRDQRTASSTRVPAAGERG
jgi:serine/threonine-protein kinase